MKPKFLLASRFSSLTTVIFAGMVGSAGLSQAATYYWDNNGATAGFGTAGGTWTAPTLGQWNTVTSGTGTPGASITTLTTDALNFGNNGTGLGAGTIAVSGTVDSGNMTFASGSGAIVLSGGIINFAATSTITVNNGADTISSNITGAATSLTKAGTGQLTLTGTNTYTGTTYLNAGKIVLNGGTVTGGGLTIGGGDSSLSVTGGTGVSSTWDAGNKDFTTGGSTYNNVQMLIDGGGVAGSAKITNVKVLNFGRSVINSTITLTNGGQMNVNGEIRLGNPYYSSTGGANMTIGGGTATSTFTGNSAEAFYIGYGERRGSNNNVVTVSSGGVLTGVGNMFVGHVINPNNVGAPPSTANKLSVTGTGTASMASISVGYTSRNVEANANVVEVINGGSLTTTTGTNYIGRAEAAGATSNANTLTVSGTGSSWNAGNKDVFVGYTNSATGTSNNNILTVGSGSSVTNVKNLTVGSGTGTTTGNQLAVNGTLSATTVTISAGNKLSGNGTVGGTVGLSAESATGSKNGGVLAPTASTSGTALKNTGTTTFNTGSIFEWDLNAVKTNTGVTTNEASYGQLVGTGAITGSGAIFNIVLGTNAFTDAFWNANKTWDNVFDGTGATTNLASIFTGGFSGSGVSSTGVVTGEGYFTFSGPKTLSWSAVPEPTSALAGLLLAAGLLRRRRR